MLSTNSGAGKGPTTAIPGTEATTNLSIPEIIQRIVQSAINLPNLSTTSLTNTPSTSTPTLQLVPLINVFEAALTDQRRLLGTLQDRLQLLAASLDDETSNEGSGPASLNSAVGDLFGRVIALGEAFSSLFNRFAHLHQVFDTASSVASPAGRHLAQLQLQKRKATQVRDLLAVWIEVKSGRGTARLDARLDANDPDTRREGARLMRRLMDLDQTLLETASDGEPSEMIELGKKYETRLLDEFHAAFAENELPAMRQVASLLMIFNGGDSCIQSFISQHTFFLEPINPDSIRSTFYVAPGQVPIQLDLTCSFTADAVLTSLYEQIAQTVEADWTYMEAVFPDDPVIVMNALLDRIMAEPVKITVEEILRQARSHSALAYLISLFTCYQASRHLLERLTSSYERHLKDWGGRLGLARGRVEERIRKVEIRLEEHLLGDLFKDHLCPLDKYIGMELAIFTEMVGVATNHMALQSQQSKRPSRVGGVISSLLGGSGTSMGGAKSVGISPMGSPTPGAMTSLDRYNSIFSFGTTSMPVTTNNGRNTGIDGARTSPAPSQNSSLRPSNSRSSPAPLSKARPLVPSLSDPSLPNDEIIRNCLLLHLQMLHRLYALLPMGGEVRGAALLQAIHTMLVLLLERYLEVALDCVQDSSEASVSRGFDPRTWMIVRAASHGMSVILSYTQDRALTLLVSASPTHYREMVAQKIELAAHLTENIDKVLRRELEAALAHVSENLLAKQRRSDFKPRADDLEAMIGPTVACQGVCEFTRKLAKTVITYLDPLNAANFLFEYGASLHIQLLNHLRNYSVSDTGAMVIQSDLKAYRTLIEVMKPAAEQLQDRYEMLWELGHLFVVRPENLRSVMQEGWLGRVDPKLIYPYIGMRADFGAAKIDHLFPDMEKSFTRLFLS